MKSMCIYTTDPFSNSDLTISTADKPLQSLLHIPFGISYIATSLDEAGYPVRLLVLLEHKKSVDILIRELKKNKPVLVCLTAVSSKYPFVKRLARVVRKESPRSYIIIGGNHATLNPESVIAEECFDAVCIGEGEKAVVEVADQLGKGLRPSGISNLWIRDGDEIQRNAPAPFIEELDALPHINRPLWDEWLQQKVFPSVLLGRGCPNRCAYCSNHALSKTAKGKWLRLRSPQDIVKELEEIDRTYNDIETVYLEVETFNANPGYVLRLCGALKRFNAGRRVPMGFGANMCVQKNMSRNDEIFKAMKQANFRFINIGLESGSEKIRRNVLRRPGYTNEEFLRFCDMARGYGMDLNIYVLFGVPEETLQDAQATVDVLKKCNPSSLMPSIFYPYPGTDLFRRIVDMGLIKKERFLKGNQERFRARIDYPDLSRRQIQGLLLTLFYKVYEGRWPWRKRVSMTVFSFLYVYPYLRYLRPRSLWNTFVKSVLNIRKQLIRSYPA
jgi:anaerobic magnesium-protoporphyrin IX monomethyl ester cyclase